MDCGPPLLSLGNVRGMPFTPAGLELETVFGSDYGTWYKMKVFLSLKERMTNDKNTSFCLLFSCREYQCLNIPFLFLLNNKMIGDAGCG